MDRGLVEHMDEYIPAFLHIYRIINLCTRNNNTKIWVELSKITGCHKKSTRYDLKVKIIEWTWWHNNKRIEATVSVFYFGYTTCAGVNNEIKGVALLCLFVSDIFFAWLHLRTSLLKDHNATKQIENTAIHPLPSKTFQPTNFDTHW